MEPIAVQQNTRPVPARGGSMLPGTAGAGVRQFLTFILGGVMYALEIVNIKEIIEYGEVTEVPMMPPSIRGIINLRGAVVPVIDLAARFGGQPASVQRRTCIVIVEAIQTGQQSDIGIMVDAVSEVLDIAGSEIEPPPSFGARIRADFIAGMGRVAGKFVIILDIARVLTVEDMAALTAISQQHNVPAMDAST